ncbi:MAG TPA: hypothetical protein VMU10_07465 [Desulfomonilia bacterium]|nr:hypothetical protein [Desulfomonilia bacterium]
MKDTCTYHPTKPALWHCKSCDADFCQECITEESLGPDSKKSLYLCPKCGLPTTRLGLSNMIDPFWTRIPSFFIYPFKLHPLILMAALPILAGSLLLAGSKAVSGLVFLINSLVMMKYSFEALKRTAHGDLTPPEISTETISDDIQVGAEVYFIYIVGFFISFLLMGTFGMSLGLLCLSVFMLLVPAMIIVLATSNSVLMALNPLLFARLAFRMGKGYLIMYLFFQILQGAPMVFLWILHQYMPQSLTVFLYSLAWNYYMLLTFHLMGYAILQYHEEIGYEATFEDKFIASQTAQKKPPMPGQDKGLVNRVNICIKDGKFDEAIDLIRKETTGVIADLELSEKYYQLLKLAGMTPELISHALPHLDLLSKSGRKEQLLEVYRECIGLDPDFTPNSRVTMKLANLFSISGDQKEAINILNRFIKANPGDPQIPHAYMTAAAIFTYRLMSPEKGLKILRLLQHNYPGHEIIPEVEQNLQKIKLAYGIS